MWTLLNYLTSAKGVVEIPGYRNFSEFARNHSATVQKVLENWQIVDGTIGFGFLRGITGSHRVSPAKLKEMMDETYYSVRIKRRVTYQMLQAKGLLAHAWLVVDMRRTHNGYILDVHDSNDFGIRNVVYKEGMDHFPMKIFFGLKVIIHTCDIRAAQSCDVSNGCAFKTFFAEKLEGHFHDSSFSI